jgi:hypothetical protein
VDTSVWIAIAFAVVVIVLIAVWFVVSRRQRQRERERLQRRFGPEYDQTVRDAGSRRSAETQLHEREERFEQLRLRPLSDEEREDALRTVAQAQARFVDDPDDAVRLMDGLVAEVMTRRGFPDEGFERRAGDLSAANPDLAQVYRRGHAVARSGRSGGSTEDRRRAVLDLRTVLEELAEGTAASEPSPR